MRRKIGIMGLATVLAGLVVGVCPGSTGSRRFTRGSPTLRPCCTVGWTIARRSLAWRTHRRSWS